MLRQSFVSDRLILYAISEENTQTMLLPAKYLISESAIQLQYLRFSDSSFVRSERKKKSIATDISSQQLWK